MAQKGTILVVDDEEPVRDLLEAILTDEGYAVETVCDGAEAIKKLEGSVYSGVITDKTMPGTNGFAVLAYAKEKFEGMPVIMTSGDWTDEEKVRAQQGKVDYTIDKPFKYKELIEILNDLTKNRGIPVPTGVVTYNETGENKK